MQITNSPFGFFFSKYNKHSLIVPLIVSSKILEISRDIEIFFSVPKTSLISFNNLIILCGDSNNITVLVSLESSNNFFFLPFFLGKNPSKIKFVVGNPLKVRAGIIDEATGNDSKSIPLEITSLTNKNPGSDMQGNPESETKAISLSEINSLIITFIELCSL